MLGDEKCLLDCPSLDGSQQGSHSPLCVHPLAQYLKCKRTGAIRVQVGVKVRRRAPPQPARCCLDCGSWETLPLQTRIGPRQPSPARRKGPARIQRGRGVRRCDSPPSARSETEWEGTCPGARGSAPRSPNSEPGRNLGHPRPRGPRPPPARGAVARATAEAAEPCAPARPAALPYVALATWLCQGSVCAEPAAALEGPGSPALLSPGATRC